MPIHQLFGSLGVRSGRLPELVSGESLQGTPIVL